MPTRRQTEFLRNGFTEDEIAWWVAWGILLDAGILNDLAWEDKALLTVWKKFQFRGMTSILSWML